MKLTLYYNSSEENKIGKSLNNATDFEGSLREESGVISPTITIKSSSPINKNYAYIPEFKRYYFIREITSVRTGIWRLNLDCDVLESFKDYFLNLNCIIDKVEEVAKANTDFNDGAFSTSEKAFNRVVQFPQQVGTSSPVFLLTCV